MINPDYKPKPFGQINSTLGPLTVFPITVGGQEKAFAELGKPLDKAEPVAVVKSVARQVCFPTEKLQQPATKPDQPILTQEDVSKFSGEDLEAFAKLYVEQSDYLFREFDTKSADGLGQVIHPQIAGESFTTYLSRVLALKWNEEVEAGKSFMKSMGVGRFSPAISQRIANALEGGNLLKRTIEVIQRQNTVMRPLPLNVPDLSASIGRTSMENLKLERERQIAPFEKLGTKLDDLIAPSKGSPVSDQLAQLIALSAQSTTYMVDQNEATAATAAAIKESGDEATRFAKRNLCLNFAVLAVAIAGLLIPIYTIYKDSHAGAAKEKELKATVAAIKGDLEKLVTAVQQLQASQQNDITALVNSIQTASTNNSSASRLIQLQEGALNQSAASEARRVEQTRRVIDELSQISATLLRATPQTNHSPPGGVTPPKP